MTLSKIIFAVRARPGLTRAQALDHLANNHGPLVAATATVRARLKTYVQNRAIDAPGVPDQTSDRDWIIEGYRDMSVHVPEPPVAADAIALREDEARFPDRATLLPIAVAPSEVMGRKGAGDVKVFTYARWRDGRGEQDENERAWAAAADALATLPIFSATVGQFVRNLAVVGEGVTGRHDAGPAAPKQPTYDAIDMWRFDSVDDAERLFADPGFATALADYERVFDTATRFRFVAREHVIFDDAGVA